MAHGSVRWFFFIPERPCPGNCSANHGDNWVFHCTFALGGSGGSPSPAENWERYFSQEFLLRWGLLPVPPPPTSISPPCKQWQRPKSSLQRVGGGNRAGLKLYLGGGGGRQQPIQPSQHPDMHPSTARGGGGSCLEAEVELCRPNPQCQRHPPVPTPLQCEHPPLPSTRIPIPAPVSSSPLPAPPVPASLR